MAKRKNKVSGLMPIGHPFPSPIAEVREDHLKCNGAAFDPVLYPKLAVVYPDGVLPELRGEFIRGWDDGRGADTGRGLLSPQGDAIRNLTGTVVGSNYIAFRGASTGAFYDVNLPVGTYLQSAGTGYAGRASGLDASRQVPTAAENRPRNVAFQYIVRAR